MSLTLDQASVQGLTSSRAYVLGSDLGVTEINADFAIVADFVDVES